MLAFHALLTCFMMAVIIYDISRFIIPNWLVLLLILLYPAMLALQGGQVEWLMGLAVAAAAFAIGFVLFMMRWMGGGDVKLLAVCFLWAGAQAGIELLFYTALLGGVLSVVLWLLRPAIAFFCARYAPAFVIPRVLTIGEPAPYGVAIAVGFLVTLWMGLLPGLPTLIIG